jgi:hypothetical protein
MFPLTPNKSSGRPSILFLDLPRAGLGRTSMYESVPGANRRFTKKPSVWIWKSTIRSKTWASTESAQRD